MLVAFYGGANQRHEEIVRHSALDPCLKLFVKVDGRGGI